MCLGVSGRTEDSGRQRTFFRCRTAAVIQLRVHVFQTQVVRQAVLSGHIAVQDALSFQVRSLESSVAAIAWLRVHGPPQSGTGPRAKSGRKAKVRKGRKA